MSIKELNRMASSRMRALRIKHKLTQKEAAKLAGVSLGHYRKIETGGRRDINMGIVLNLARAYGLEPWQLLGRELPGARQVRLS